MERVSRVFLFLVSLILLVAPLQGCSGIKTVTREISSSDGISVSLVWRVDASGKSVPKGYQHPWEVDRETLDALLASIHFSDNYVVFKGKQQEAFPVPERSELVGLIQKAFAEAGPDQAVEFSFTHNKKRLAIFSRSYFSDGLMFRKGGRFNCAFRNLALGEEECPEWDNQVNIGDPTVETFRSYWLLVPGDGQKLEAAQKSVVGQKHYSNWISLDLSRDWCAIAKQPPAATPPPKGQAAQPAPPATAAPLPGNPGPTPAAPQPQGAPTAR